MPDPEPGFASSVFHYVPHPHLEHRKKLGAPTIASAIAQVHGNSRAGKLNAAVGLRITLVVGTMWAGYIFAIIALISLPSAVKSGNLTIIIAWISSNFLQLVLLPVIIVGQNIQAAAADSRSQATYDDAVAVLEEAKQIQVHLLAQDEKLTQLVTELCAPKQS